MRGQATQVHHRPGGALKSAKEGIDGSLCLKQVLTTNETELMGKKTDPMPYTILGDKN